MSRPRPRHRASTATAPKRRHHLRQPSGSIGDAGREPLDPEQSPPLARQMRRPCHLKGRAQCNSHRLDRLQLAQACDAQARRRLGRGQHLEGDLGQNAQRAPASRHQLHQIIAGDVLHHPPAILDDAATAIDKADPDQAVARRPRLNAARTRDIGSDDTTDGRLTFRPEQRAVIHRLERQALPVTRQRRLHLGQRRSGLGHDGQRARLIQLDPRHPGHRQDLARHRPPDGPRAAADHMQVPRPRHDLAQLRSRSQGSASGRSFSVSKVSSGVVIGTPLVQ